MAYKRIWIFVEGSTDSYFCERVISSLLNRVFDEVKLIECAQRKSEIVQNLLKSIKSMGSYLYLTDINSSPCFTAKKEKVSRELKGQIDEGSMVIVKQEIESWYAAGIDDDIEKQFKIKPIRSTNDLTKEKFDSIIPSRFDSRIDFMQEILKGFSKETAIEKNESFSYLMAKVTGLIDNNMEANK